MAGVRGLVAWLSGAAPRFFDNLVLAYGHHRTGQLTRRNLRQTVLRGRAVPAPFAFQLTGVWPNRMPGRKSLRFKGRCVPHGPYGAILGPTGEETLQSAIR